MRSDPQQPPLALRECGLSWERLPEWISIGASFSVPKRMRGVLIPPSLQGLVSVPSCLAAVDVEALAGDEGGPFEVEDSVGDVADLARATERVDGS